MYIYNMCVLCVPRTTKQAWVCVGLASERVCVPITEISCTAAQCAERRTW